MGNISLDFFRYFEIWKLGNYLGKNSPVFLLFQNFEITKLFGEKFSSFFSSISKLRNYLDNIS